MSELAPQSIRLVVDTNIILRGLLNTRSASGRVLEAVDKRAVVLLLSRSLLLEYHAVLTDEDVVQRFPELSDERVEAALRRLRYFSAYFRTVREHFEFLRDPRDAKLIELAIAGNATHLVSNDNDLLSLRTSHADAAKRLRQRLPRLQVLGPAELLLQVSGT